MTDLKQNIEKLKAALMKKVIVTRNHNKRDDEWELKQ